MTKISVADFDAIIESALPLGHEMGMKTVEIEAGRATIRIPYDDSLLRPGGTIAGPVMMSAADAAMYAAIMSEIGPVLLAVTTNFNINFMRRPRPGDLRAEARIMKLGKRLAVVEVDIWCGGEEDVVAHATGTYSIPPGEEAS